MNGRGRLLALALALVVFAVTASWRDGDGGGSAAALSLEGAALRDFIAGVLLTRDDVPNLNQDQPGESFRSPQNSVAGQFGGVSLLDSGWAGTYARPFAVRAPSGLVFTLGQLVMAFQTIEGARTVLDEMKASDIDELGQQFVGPSGATGYVVRDLDIAAGEDSWAILVAGTTPLEGKTEELVFAQVAFRRGPLLALVSSVGYVELNEPLLRDLVAKLDDRMREGLEGL